MERRATPDLSPVELEDVLLEARPPQLEVGERVAKPALHLGGDAARLVPQLRAVVDQAERRARDSRELALELARVRELGAARVREVDVVLELYLWFGRRAASADGG